ncbi:MAG: hypothetical protein WC340_05515 [Kiritimatiellia bacterium]
MKRSEACAMARLMAVGAVVALFVIVDAACGAPATANVAGAKTGANADYQTMHSKIEFPGALKPIFDDLSKSMHVSCIRNRQRMPVTGIEVSLGDGYTLEAGTFKGQPHLDVLLNDLRQFMAVSLEVREAPGGYPIRLRRSQPQSMPEGVSEAHRIEITDKGCLIEAGDLDGLRRAIFRLEDEMQLRRAPLLPVGDTTRWTTIRTRMIRSPVAPYRWLSGWELTDNNDYYPEAYLNRLAHYGINGLWIPGLLRHLVASKTIPELGPPEHRLAKLKAIIDKAERYGIRIYFFCIEPRALYKSHPAVLAHPEIVGSGYALCPSEPLVLEYVRETMKTLFTEVPKLGGVVNIFSGERTTTCWSSSHKVAQGCPRCSVRSKSDVHAETLKAFVQGIRAAGSDAEFMAWTYGLDSSGSVSPIVLEFMEKAGRDVIWLGNFEHGMTKQVCGRKAMVQEYSLSCLGPSVAFADMAKAAKRMGRTLYAKLQVGTSYELSSVPYIPVPGIEYDKLKVAGELGVTGSMMTWIPGGFPSPMLRAAGQATFEPKESKDAFLLRMAGVDWGEQASVDVAKAWRIFAETWQRYPIDNQVLYWGPITRGPAYHLHLEREKRPAWPYNWGYTRQRDPQPWEDNIARWVGPFTPQQIADAFRDMATRWSTGLASLEEALKTVGREPELVRQVVVAQAVRLHFLSAANVYEFYALRDSLPKTDALKHPAILQRMQVVAKDEIRAAEEMKALLALDPTLGFASEIFDFSYSKPLLEEKILQVQEMLPTLARWELNGIEPELLNRTVEEAEKLNRKKEPARKPAPVRKNDSPRIFDPVFERDPLRWGD